MTDSKKQFLTLFTIVSFLCIATNLWGQDIFGKKDVPKAHLNKDGFSSSEECGKCHKDTFKTWKQSLHSMSINNPVFWASYLKAYYENSEAAMKTCLSCHAPITRFNNDYKLTKEITNEGINCSFCHSISKVSKGGNRFEYKHVFGLLIQGPSKSAITSAHKYEFNKLFKQSLFCAGCHEYQSENGLKILETFSEWQNGPYSKKGIQCQNCHMRKIKGKSVIKSIEGLITGRKRVVSTHDIAGGHSLSMRKKSVEVKIKDVKRHKQRVSVTVQITNKGAGHKIPTGLPSKQIILNVSVETDDGETRQEKQKIYQKILLDKNGKTIESDSDIMLGKAYSILIDNRISPKETLSEKFVFFVPENKPINIVASVYYSHSPVIFQTSPIHTKIGEAKKRL